VEDSLESVVVSFFSLEIISAILFSTVLIHYALIPMFDPINRTQKNLARAQPMLDFLLVKCPVKRTCVICDT
jgi:hypothetical protein